MSSLPFFLEKDVPKSSAPVPENVALFGNGVFAGDEVEVIRVGLTPICLVFLQKGEI